MRTPHSASGDPRQEASLSTEVDGKVMGENEPVVAVTTRRVTMGDVDAVQVYAPAYFRWMDAAYSQLLADLGHPLRELLDMGVGSPAVSMECQFVRPVGIDDCVRSRSWVERVGEASFEVRHTFFCNSEQVAQGRVVHVWMNVREYEKQRAPDWLRKNSATKGRSSGDELD